MMSPLLSFFSHSLIFRSNCLYFSMWIPFAHLVEYLLCHPSLPSSPLLLWNHVIRCFQKCPLHCIPFSFNLMFFIFPFLDFFFYRIIFVFNILLESISCFHILINFFPFSSSFPLGSFILFSCSFTFATTSTSSHPTFHCLQGSPHTRHSISKYVIHRHAIYLISCHWDSPTCKGVLRVSWTRYSLFRLFSLHHSSYLFPLSVSAEGAPA